MFGMFNADEPKNAGARRRFVPTSGPTPQRSNSKKAKMDGDAPPMQEEGTLICTPTIELSDGVPTYSNTIELPVDATQGLDSSLHTVLSESIDLVARLGLGKDLHDDDMDDDLSFTPDDVNLESINNMDITDSSGEVKDETGSAKLMDESVGENQMSIDSDTEPQRIVQGQSNFSPRALFSPKPKVAFVEGFETPRKEPLAQPSEQTNTSMYVKVATISAAVLMLWAKFRFRFGDDETSFASTIIHEDFEVPSLVEDQASEGDQPNDVCLPNMFDSFFNNSLAENTEATAVAASKESVLKEDFSATMTIIHTILWCLIARLVCLRSRSKPRASEPPRFEKKLPCTPKVEKSLADFDLSKYEEIKMEGLREQLHKRKCSYEGKKYKLIRRLAYVIAAELETRTVVQLRRKLKSMGFKQAGKKRALIKKIVENAPRGVDASRKVVKIEPGIKI